MGEVIKMGEREPLVRGKVVAEYLGVCARVVERWSRQKDDPLPARKLGGRYHYRMSEVESWLERRRA